MRFLEKLLPLNGMLSMALRLGLLNKPLGLAAKLWNKAEGVRTQAALALAALLALSATAGLVPFDTVSSVILALGGLAGGTFLEKLQKALPLLEKASEAVKAEADKLDAPKE